jgi:protein-S-isoprenylcysteine O-methyltransferase Ste14
MAMTDQQGGSIWRSLTAFVFLPGTIAFIVPWLLRPDAIPMHLDGVPVLLIGIGLLLWCVRDFHVIGRGSLAPWAPPRHLVIVGLYRFSRNPMYVAVVVILVGWALAFRSTTLWIYAACVAIAFHFRVVFNEEPYLARTHGAEWTAYRARVPRWMMPRAFLLVVLLVSAGCAVRLIGDYDDTLDRGVTAVQQQTELYLMHLRSAPSTQFDRAFHDSVAASLVVLETRAASLPRYGIVAQQLGNLRAQFVDFRRLDSTMARPFPPASVGAVESSIAVSVESILKLELALRRGNSPSPSTPSPPEH